MIITLDRAARTMAGGGVCITVNPESQPVREWCWAAHRAGYDLAGMPLEMWDRGCRDTGRTEPMHCLTYLNAMHVLAPPPKDPSYPRRRKVRRT